MNATLGSFYQEQVAIPRRAGKKLRKTEILFVIGMGLNEQAKPQMSLINELW